MRRRKRIRMAVDGKVRTTYVLHIYPVFTVGLANKKERKQLGAIRPRCHLAQYFHSLQYLR